MLSIVRSSKKITQRSSFFSLKVFFILSFVLNLLTFHSYAGIDDDLCQAVKEGNISRVAELISNGADVNAKLYGETVLMLAAYYGHTEIVKLLLDKGADVNAKSNNGDTALMFAAANGHTEIVKLLLDKGADVDAENDDGDTAEIWATEFLHADIVKLLIDKSFEAD